MSGARYRKERQCAFDGCTEITRGLLGYCPQHFNVAYRCEFDEHCQNRCSVRNMLRLCHEHHWYARKLRHERMMQWLEETAED